MIEKAKKLIEKNEQLLRDYNPITNTQRKARLAANKESRLQFQILLGNLILNAYTLEGIEKLNKVNSIKTFEELYWDYMSFKKGNKINFPRLNYSEVNKDKEESFRNEKSKWYIDIDDTNIKQYIKYCKENRVYIHWKFEQILEKQIRYKKAGVFNIHDLVIIFINDMPKCLPEINSNNPIKKAEREFIVCKIPGFFPTPKKVIDKMLEYADLRQENSILEPSAGCGNIADEIRKLGFEPAVCEINHSLRDVLELKKYYIEHNNFLEYNIQKFDRIIMNPPFENFQDIEHIHHAFDLLNPNGILVSICCESCFFRKDGIAEKFRNWLKDVEAEVIKLETGSFQDKSTLRQTGTNSRIIVIRK